MIHVSLDILPGVQDIQIPQNPESEEFSNYVVEMEKLKAKVAVMLSHHIAMLANPRTSSICHTYPACHVYTTSMDDLPAKDRRERSVKSNAFASCLALYEEEHSGGKFTIVDLAFHAFVSPCPIKR